MAMPWKGRKRWIVLAIMTLVMVVMVVVAAIPSKLSVAESQCVGSWAFTEADDLDVQIVYHLHADRRAVEEHYYLSSASPQVPRLTFRGRWDVDSSGRLTVQPSTRFHYAGDALSGYIGSFIDNSRQAWARPVLTRFYRIEAARDDGLDLRASRDGKEVRIRMLPYHRMP